MKILFQRFFWIGLCFCATIGLKGSNSFHFEKHIRPLLSEKCISCHSSVNAQNSFRLDSREAFQRNPQSRINLIVSIIKSDNTPSDDSPHTLTRTESELLNQWVKSGAYWPDNGRKLDPISGGKNHWAFLPIKSYLPPSITNQVWSQNPIDPFIFKGLKENGLKPSPPADPEVLIRRVYFNIIGFPPTYDELQRLLDAWDENEYEKLIDKLLMSPEYGERWGRHWLDVARYADAKGYNDAGEVKYPFAYTYRDYVIQSFNEDLPFDSFIKNQIAADKFTNSPTSPHLAALGFLNVGHRFNFFPDDILDDKIDVVTRGFLGVTASCARCHDHKSDPISTQDYYSLFGIFRNSYEPTPDELPVLKNKPNSEIQKKALQAAQEYWKLREKLYQKITNEMRMWGGDYLEYIVETSPQHRTKSQPTIITPRGLLRVKSAYASGGIVRWRNLLKSTNDSHPVLALWHRAWNLNQKNFQKEIHPILNILKTTEDCNEFLVHLAQTYPGGVHNMNDVAQIYGKAFKITCESSQNLKNTQIDPRYHSAIQKLYKFLHGPDSPGTFQKHEADDFYTLNESTSVRTALANIERVYLGSWDDTASRAMVLKDRSNHEKTIQTVYQRGNKHSVGPIAPEIIPGWISGGESIPIDNGSGRKELALAIASNANPLTARVIVNRIWNWHFGQGLVSTPSDFGVNGGRPSHPELLDFLALWFIENGWSIKKLNTLILRSQTYRQASKLSDPNYELDPQNVYLWRMNINRLDFESMRDAIIKISGQLDQSIGGLPVMKSPNDISNNRRTVYSYVDRENLADVFMVFDFPSPDISAAQRLKTTVPQQTLFLLNSEFILHHSEKLIESIHPSMTMNDMVSNLFRTVLSRVPSKDEMEQSLEYLTSGKADKIDTASRLRELAQILLLSNEFQFVR